MLAPGTTETEPLDPATFPGAGEIESEVAPLLTQDRSEDPPAAISVGEAVNEEIVGRLTNVDSVVAETGEDGGEESPTASVADIV